MKKNNEPIYIVPAENFGYEVPEKRVLSMEDIGNLKSTFFLLDEFCTCSELSPSMINDGLLLITTCRNEFYTLNAMYVEAVGWGQEGKENNYKGFTDAIKKLRGGISGREGLDVAAKKSKRILEYTEKYLEQFTKKHDVYFNKFHAIHDKLEDYCNNLASRSDRERFSDFFIKFENGPSVDDDLIPPSDNCDPRCSLLMNWFCVANPLTFLMEECLNEILIGGQRLDGAIIIKHADQLQKGLQVLREGGYECPDITSQEFYIDSLNSGRCDKAKEKVLSFINFSETVHRIIMNYLFSKLPYEDLNVKFPLKKKSIQETSEELHEKITSMIKELQENINRDNESILEAQQALSGTKQVDEQERLAEEINKLGDSRERYLIEYRKWEHKAREIDDSGLSMLLSEFTMKLSSLQEGQEEIKNNQKGLNKDHKRLHRDHKAINKNIIKLRGEILTCFNEIGKEIVSKVVALLSPNQLEDVKNVLYGICMTHDIDTEEVLCSIKSVQQSINEIQKSQISIHDNIANETIEKFSESLKDPEINIKHKLKYCIPFIPLFLSYEGSVEFNTGINLRKAWEWLKNKHKNN